MRIASIVFLVLLSLSAASAQTNVSGTISVNTDWQLAGSPYVVTGSIFVNPAATLTVDSGVVVLFQSNQGMTVRGTVLARQAVFTSVRDTSGGSPAKGDWSYIQIGDGSGAGTAIFDTCHIRYGGTTSHPSGNPNVYAYWGTAAFHGGDITNGNNYGLLVYTSGIVTLTNTIISSCDWPIVYNGPGSLVFNGAVNLTGNKFNGVAIAFTNNSNAFVLDTINVPYVFGNGYGDYFINNGGSLQIASGSIVKVTSGAHIVVNGSFNAVAAAGQQIYFTAFVDDNLGGDTNGDGTSTSPTYSYWGGVVFNDASSDGSCIMRRCKIAYAGSGATGGISMYNASPTIDSCDMANNYYGAMMQYVSNPNFTNNTIGSSQLVPIAISFSSNPVFSNNTFSFSDNAYDAIGLLGGTLTANSVLPIRSVTSIPNVTYLLLQNVIVPAGLSLTINKGIVIKGYNSGQYIDVAGKLVANATPDSMITVTSAKDDNFGNPGDTNKDGTQTVPAVGDWGGIIFEQGSDTLSILNFCRFKYGNVPNLYYSGVYLNGGILTVGSSPTISNCEITNVVYGLTFYESSNPKAINDTIINTQYTPIALSVSANPTLSGLRFINSSWTALGIIGENLGFNGTIHRRDVAGFPNITYVLLGNLTVNSGTNVSVDPGVVIKSGSPGFYIGGGFQAVGDAVNGQIVFTSLKDDNFGNPGDTNGDGAASAPGRGDWSTIQFLATSDDNFSHLYDCLIKYAGSNIGGVTFTNAGPKFSNSTLSDINNYGIECDGGATPYVDSVNIINCRLDPIAMSLTSNPTFGNNVTNSITFSANGSKGIRILEGTLSSNATLIQRNVAGINNIAYIVDGLTVASNAVLTISPGVVIKFVGYYSYISVSGALIAEGLPANKIIFTALADDSNGGDTNNDGNASTPARGNWSVIDFQPSSADSLNSLKNCEFRYGGSGAYDYPYYYGAIRVFSAKAKVDSCVIQQSATSALGSFGSASPSFTHLQINNISSVPVAMSMFSTPTFSSDTALNIGLMALGIIPETYSVNNTVPVRDFAGYSNITYYFFSTSTINSGTTITVPAGVVFKGNGSNFLNVNGALVVDGTAAQPVIFTDYRDDSYGNPFDTNQDGSGTAPTINGSIASIYFSDISNDTSNIVKHALFRYANEGCYTLSASPTIVGCMFDRDNWGVYLGGVSNPNVDSCTFNNLVYAPIVTSLVSYPNETIADVISGSTYKMIGVIQETLVQDVTLIKHNFAGVTNIPYLFGPYTIGTGATLTIDPGVILKFFNGGYIDVNKGLMAQGGSTADSTIVFTSVLDDFYGGDSNSDSTATSVLNNTYYGGWSGLIFENQALDPLCQLKNCIVRFATAYNSGAGITTTSANPTIMNCTITQNWNGITANAASNPVVNYCDIYKNYNKGIQNTNLSFNIDARNNWWGDNSGPTHSGNPGGKGDAVTDSVQYNPFRTIGAQEPFSGDVSLNGTVQAYDATLILKYTVDTLANALNPIQKKVADVSGDGHVLAFDASLILQYVVGNISSFPVDGGKNAPVARPKVLASSVEIGGESGDRSSTISVPIRVEGIKNLASANIDLVFDNKILTPKDVTLGESVSGMSIAHAVSGNKLRIALAGSSFVNVDGNIVTVTFTVGKDVHGTVKTPVAFSRLFLNEVDFTSSAQSGEMTIIGKPTEFALMQNFPNPFNPSTTIRYQIPEDATHITLTVYNSLGEAVKTLVNDVKAAGTYDVLWDGTGNAGAPVSSGTYFVRISASGNQPYTGVKKMLLMK